MPMKPSRIVLSSGSPTGPYLSYHSTRCPKLPGKLVLLYFAGADRHAASTVVRPRLPGTALLTASLVVVLLVASTLWTGAQPAEAGSTARFEPGTCPITPEPIHRPCRQRSAGSWSSPRVARHRTAARSGCRWRWRLNIAFRNGASEKQFPIISSYSHT